MPITDEGDWIAFSPDGRTIAFDGLANGGSVIRFHGIGADATAEIRVPYPHNRITGIAFSPSGHIVAVADDSGSLQLWDPGTGKPVGPAMSGHQGRIDDIAFSPDGTHIATAGQDKATCAPRCPTSRPGGQCRYVAPAA
jgi:WD40 repeat protein